MGVDEESRDRILAALFSDDYLTLMPAERRTIRTEVEVAATRGEPPRIRVDGFDATATAQPARRAGWPPSP